MLALVASLSYSANAQSKFDGIWEGKLDIGTTIRAVFHISTDATGKIVTTMDSPDQGARGIATDSTTIKGDSIIVSMSKLMAVYRGKLTDEANISGSLKQSIKVMPLALKKVTKASEKERPQNPKPPFNYTSEDVTFQNADGSIIYGATITIPKGKGPFPAVLLITGSGAQNRDEELMGHKPFAVIADYLSNKGYVVLRVDDRGTGSTTGNFKNATSADFAQDANAEMDYLKTRPEVDVKKLGLIGHSEGGMIAPMVAASRKDIDFVVLLAGPGVKISQLMAEQNTETFRSLGIDSTAATKYGGLVRDVYDEIGIGKTKSEFKKTVEKIVKNWEQKNDHRIVWATTHISNDSTRDEWIKNFTDLYKSPWFMYFLGYDPVPNLKKLTCKVLALNGTKDIQVISSSNIPGIEAALKNGKCKDFEVHQLTGLNHLFQQCKTCRIDEYGLLDETFSPDALKIMGDWMDKHVK